jgi:sucrose-6-phosphate hydrolase SacC (GH32 family)
MSPRHCQFANFGISRRDALRNLGLLTGLSLPSSHRIFAVADEPEAKFRVGAFTKIYDPSGEEKDRWYINDHTFIRDEDGRWHMFGITHREPAKALDEKFLAHAIAPDLLGPWKKQPHVLPRDEKAGETVVWAPYVLRHDGSYWMYYCGGGKDHARYQIRLATSVDLFHWTRHPVNPMVADGYDARDPMVFRHNDEWILYYAATSAPTGGYHVVKAATSRDLVHWSHGQEVFRSTEKGTYGGPTESPFVVERNGKFYLFVCTNQGYNATALYESQTLHWELKDFVGKFAAHAAEVIHTPDDKWYVTRAGWGQGGVYLAQLSWKE